MNRRTFSQGVVALGVGTSGLAVAAPKHAAGDNPAPRHWEEPARKLPADECDVVVAGAGTAGVVAAIAAARTGARTALIERKGYPGGTVTEGGTALHSFHNLWKAFPGVEKRQVVRGIAQEIIDRLADVGGCTGHAEMTQGYTYDSVCTAIDTGLYKLITWRTLAASGGVYFEA
jgi:NADPH-dependent 2,4-dienoyl-CoA reductase/sulfur reductase-like enzyme